MVTFDVRLQTRGTTRFGFADDRTNGALTADQRYLRKDIIQSPAIVTIQEAQSGTTQKWFTWDLSHPSISGYKRLRFQNVGVDTVESVTFSSPPLEGEKVFEEFATSAGDLNNIQVRNSTMTFNIKTLHTNSGAERSIKVYVKIYHRTSGGTETLLAEYTKEVGLNITEDNWHIFSESVTINQKFLVNEILVIKYSVEDKGIPT